MLSGNVMTTWPSSSVKTCWRTGSYGHLEEFVLLGCEVRSSDERRFLRVLPGVRFRGRAGLPWQRGGFGSDGRPRHGAAPLSRYAGVAVRSRKANRLKLYTRFIRPIFALALMRPIVRTLDRVRFASCARCDN